MIGTPKERFVVKCSEPDEHGCVKWLGSSTLGGYGVFRVREGVRTTAHRAAWIIFRGEIPDGKYVLHRCDNPSCVNVDHLFIGTPAENTHDMVAKGRHGWRSGMPWQKLNAIDGERIRDLRQAGCTQQQIADWLGVSRPLISLILSGRVKHSLTT